MGVVTIPFALPLYEYASPFPFGGLEVPLFRADNGGPHKACVLPIPRYAPLRPCLCLRFRTGTVGNHFPLRTPFEPWRNHPRGLDRSIRPPSTQEPKNRSFSAVTLAVGSQPARGGGRIRPCADGTEVAFHLRPILSNCSKYAGSGGAGPLLSAFTNSSGGRYWCRCT